MYRAPVGDIAHTLRHVTGLGEQIAQGRAGELSDDLLDAILEEAGRFAAEEIATLYKSGDEQGARLNDGAVTTPDGWSDLYRRWIEGGWNALAGPTDFGGQGLPTSLATAVMEMWNSGSMAFALCPTLTTGAVEALEKHGAPELKRLYLEKLVSGEWTGTMNLTEPQAGSDLSALKSRAEPVGDGSYRIFGQKIFITFGEHDYTDNIVHLVLARLPDAPRGTQGISLFLVPKFLVKEDGSLGARNDVFCHSIEHKLGIHASPTCTMIYGDGKFGETPGALGWLIGEENRGLACMFTMMNNARLAVGIQGVGIGEAAYQKALSYAHERRQGKAPGHDGGGMAPIILHPDVRRDLMTMKALTQASRAIAYNCAHAIDRARDDETGFWAERAGLLTPVAKAFPTDAGVQIASIGIQVHGGMGFIEETGAAALLRDSRIGPIYEGTNGIQAIDLVTRKLPQSGGDHVRAFIDELKQEADALRASNNPAFGQAHERLAEAIAHLEEATAFLLDALAQGRTGEALAGATPYLKLFALAAGGCWLARGACAGEEPGRVVLCRYFCENLIGESASLKAGVIAGGASIEEADAVLGAV